jgi:hypothetical protein
VGDPQHRVLVRGAHHTRRQREAGLTPGPSGRARFPLDGFVVPALVLLVAREIHLFDPLRVLAWRLLHEDLRVPAWLAALLPSPSGAVDRDPIALALTSVAMLVAIAYAASAPFVRVRWRAAQLALAAAVLVVLPTVGLVTMGLASGRPYGQDGGVVQLPLAMDRLLAGESPYGADYSDSMLGKQARVSAFWRDYGGNPILRHHAYLPGTHLLMLPGYLVGRAIWGAFDTRAVTLAAFALTAWLAWRFVGRGASGLVAAGLVLVNPLVWWHQVFGANDVMVAGLLLACALAADRERPVLAGALLGLACATKQLAWPFAPFLVVHLLRAEGFADLARRETWVRAARPLAAAAAVFVGVVGPVLLLDPRAFWGDIVAYNVGLAGGDAYPLGGTPGFGFANLLIYAGAVGSLKDHVSFAPFYLLLVPLGLALLRRQMRERDAAGVLVHGSIALVASLYVSRVVHPNYLVLAAILLPIGCLARRRDALLAVGPLALLAIAVEYAQNEVLRTAWEQAVAHGAAGLLGPFGPRAGASLTADPLGALVSALVAGVAVAWLASAVAPESWRARMDRLLVGAGVATAVLLPTALFVAIGSATAHAGGPLRGQDIWLADVAYAGAAPVLDETHPPRVREAWSSSFRQEPPAALVPPRPPLPGTALAGRALAAAGRRDPRPLVLAGLLGAAMLAAFTTRGRGLLAFGLTCLAPALACGLAYGAPDALLVAAVLAALALRARRRDAWSGVAGGLGAITQAQVAPVPLVVFDRAGERTVSWPLVASFVGVGLAALAAERVFGWRWPGAGPHPPSLGLGGLFVYFGAESGALARAVRDWLWPFALAAPYVLPLRRPLWAMALAMLLVLWAAGTSASWLAAPIVLLALAALDEPFADREPEAATA